MYINFRLLNEKGILLTELMVLIAINQKEAHLITDLPYEYFEEQGLIEYTKQGTNKEDKVRLSKNGKSLLNALTTPNATQENMQLVEDLIALYEHYGKETGNTLEIRDRVLWFIQATGFGEKAIKTCVEEYLEKNTEFTMRLDNLFWKPQSSAFSVNFSLSDSRLFSDMMKKYKLPIHFFLKPSEKRKAKDNWLFDCIKLKVPRGLDSDNYWTGSEKTDKEALKRLQQKFKEI